ncbi:GTPase IMAP family member 5-like isoform X1 [Megalops cyprinoides]|uniref:GTPase IMAP family member 5-like isoform X1 n=1 Tax=Megalops cyprinoides TaxID=118141 RepID=UPI0018655795|nr:GTPase IMAP family member 5-like isoform X1 [Megalops cyprinoides]XP_036406776.1 GTPase IMAP family member 5-like isoform X1 [Megalops cyprinoides]
MTMAVTSKLLFLLLATSVSGKQESCSSRKDKIQSDGLGCSEETHHLYTDVDLKANLGSRSHLEGTKDAAGLRLVLVGLSGVGKSASGNTILGREEFKSGIGSSSLTLRSRSRQGEVGGRPITVVDTPDMFHPELSEEKLRAEMERAVSLCDPGPHAFLLVIQLGRFTLQEQGAVERLQELFSKTVKGYTIILFTFGDKLRKVSIEEFLSRDTNLQKLVRQCGGRYQVFNNNDMYNRNQVRELLEKVDNMVLNNERKFFDLIKEREMSMFSLFSAAEELVSFISERVSTVMENRVDVSQFVTIVAQIYTLYMTVTWLFRRIGVLWARALGTGNNTATPIKDGDVTVSDSEGHNKTPERSTAEVSKSPPMPKNSPSETALNTPSKPKNSPSETALNIPSKPKNSPSESVLESSSKPNNDPSESALNNPSKPSNSPSESALSNPSKPNNSPSETALNSPSDN